MAATSTARRRRPLEPLYQIIEIDRETGRERITIPAYSKDSTRGFLRAAKRTADLSPGVRYVARRLRGIPDLTRNTPSRDWALLVVSRPDGWVPSGRTDVPPVLQFFEITSAYVSEGRARAVAIAFNLASMAGNGRTWAIPMQIEGMPCALRMGKGGAR